MKKRNLDTYIIKIQRLGLRHWQGSDFKADSPPCVEISWRIGTKFCRHVLYKISKPEFKGD